ncbi:NUDIX hydrolase [Macrococcus animalis]|uniref:NUDIX hydrolase n=1 Tax=Macrococcus animalis TaxID=3395467 RepID=UPI0039BDD40E
MSEIWELLDMNRQKTGILHERGVTVPDGLYHLVVEIWVQKPNGDLLLTQRHPDKPLGLKWECSRGSAVAGEDGVVAAYRELFEEAGIFAEIDVIQFKGHTIHSNYITETYLYESLMNDISLNLQAEEVVDAKWVHPSEIEQNLDELIPELWDRYCKFIKVG